MSSYPPPGQGGGPSYPPPPGGQPPWGYGAPGPTPGDNRATWALVIGIVSIVLTCCCGPLAIGGGIVAIVLAQQVRKQVEQYGGDASSATAAFWVGVAAVSLGALSMLTSIVFGVLDLWAF
ncbi:hypothetical protein [Aeromicrobium sp.]|uniref:hypothetical protein n=1 Tax=Aeromicrobium sp. TaxID=1871063 RepID=UPI0028B0F4CA|nr:hypothetical protein [Aeromicrobium sp.]